MKRASIILIIILSFARSQAQVTTKIPGDSTKLYQTGGGNNELILENSTRSRTGAFIRNRINGRTDFSYVLDSVWAAAGTMYFRRGPTTLSFNLAGIALPAVDSVYERSDSLFYIKNGSENFVATLGGGSALTLQDVFDNEPGGSVLTKHDTIDLNNKILNFKGRDLHNNDGGIDSIEGYLKVYYGDYQSSDSGAATIIHAGSVNIINGNRGLKAPALNFFRGGMSSSNFIFGMGFDPASGTYIDSRHDLGIQMETQGGIKFLVGLKRATGNTGNYSVSTVTEISNGGHWFETIYPNKKLIVRDGSTHILDTVFLSPTIGDYAAAKFHTVGTVRHASLGSASSDTTTYKPAGINSSGDLIGMTYWPGNGPPKNDSSFGVLDNRAAQNRYFSGANVYTVDVDSTAGWSIRATIGTEEFKVFGDGITTGITSGKFAARGSMYVSNESAWMQVEQGSDMIAYSYVESEDSSWEAYSTSRKYKFTLGTAASADTTVWKIVADSAGYIKKFPIWNIGGAGGIDLVMGDLDTYAPDGAGATISNDTLYMQTYNSSGEFPGLVPAAGSPSGKFLRDDGSWQTVSSSGETNTGSNLGGGLDNYSTKVGVDLRFNTFSAADFNLASNVISLDVTNGPRATTSTIGFLSDTDWDTFNDKTSITNGTNNRIITSLGANNTANAEANLLFDGSLLDLTGTFKIKNTTSPATNSSTFEMTDGYVGSPTLQFLKLHVGEAGEGGSGSLLQIHPGNGGQVPLYLILNTETNQFGTKKYTAFVDPSSNTAGWFSANLDLYYGGDGSNSSLWVKNTSGKVWIGAPGTTPTPTARLHLGAGSATANTAPLKFTSGTVLGTTEAGAIEYDGTHLYFTATNAGTRYQLDQQTGVTTFSGLTDVNLTGIATNDFLKWDGTDWVNRTPTNVRSDLGLVIGTNLQAYDADLTTYAGITPSANVQTLLAAADYAAFKTSLSLNNVDNTSDATKNSATATLTNKRITLRDGSTASSATPTINTDNVDVYRLTAQTVDITSVTTNLSGTPTIGQRLGIWITGTASRAITWGASFVATSIALPTTTSGTATLKVMFIWDGSNWAMAGYN